jgi:hypothetical protein
LIAVVGCEVEPVGPPDCVAVVEPGYYYDEAYVDVGGVRHPRDYWYHDGHAWAHRDNVPHGFAARDRSTVGYVHGNAPHGGPAGGGGGDHGGGGGHGGR